MSTTRLPNPKGLEFIYHGDHLEVIRTDGKTPTLKDMKVRDAWFEYLKKIAKAGEVIRNLNSGI